MHQTQNYGFIQWEKHDKPLMDDFNDAFAAIDRELDAAVAELREENERLRERLEKKTNIGTPQKHTPDFQNGIVADQEYENSYYKTSENMVLLFVSCSQSEGNALPTHILTLPEGFHPEKAIYGVGVIYDDSYAVSFANIKIERGGHLTYAQSSLLSRIIPTRLVLSISFISQ